MRFNLKRFLTVFLLLETVVLMAGCSASWLSAISALLPAAQAAVSAIIAFIMALEGKTVPASVSAAIQKIGADVAAEIQNLQSIISAAAGAVTQGLIGQIETVLQAIVSNLGSILANADITDSATVAKLTQLVGLAVAAFQAILALVPMVKVALTTGHDLPHEDKIATKVINNAHSAIKETYKAVLKDKTGSAEVDAALTQLPQELP